MAAPGVFRLADGDQNLSSLLEMFSGLNREPLIAQQYLKDVRKGDKRIILVDGEPVGAINRVPPEGDARSNMHVGGVATHTELTDREREICARIGPMLKEQGFIFVGIDVIGDYMTEINVTSPTGIREVKRFSGTDIAALIWDAVERKRWLACPRPPLTAGRCHQSRQASDGGAYVERLDDPYGFPTTFTYP